jgi:spore coat polysaccharide biosynthesis protein SpsF
MTSTRLPGKCIKEIAGYPMLNWVLYALEQTELVDYIGIVVPNELQSDVFFHDYVGYYIYNGEKENVLKRYYDACALRKLNNNDNVIRITGDCPLLAFYYEIIDSVIGHHIDGQYDYTHNRHEFNYPSGLDVEVMTFKTLKYIAQKCFTNEQEKEHVTLYIKNNPDNFNIGYIESGYKFKTKFSVDTQEDFNLVEDILYLHTLCNRNFINNFLKGM